MMKLPFKVEKVFTGRGTSDSVYLDPGEDPVEALTLAVADALGTDIEITIGGTTMFLAAWRDPEHWADDWAQKFDCDLDGAPERVAQLLADATSE